jgi:hypothetical protein
LDRRVLGYIFVQTRIVVLKREWILSITWIESKYTPILSYPRALMGWSGEEDNGRRVERFLYSTFLCHGSGTRRR